MKTLTERGISPKQENDQSQAQLAAQDANVQALEKAIQAQRSNVAAVKANLARLEEVRAYRQVKAPFDGVITWRYVDRGTLIQAGTTSDTQALPVVRVSALGALNGEEQWEKAVEELMAEVDRYIPIPERDIDKPFLMPVEDVFSISGRGTVVTGRVERGIVKVGEELEIVGLKPTLKTVCTGVEMFRKLLDEGQAGDNVGCLLRGLKREEVERGQVLAKPGSITPHTNFKAEVYVLTKEEGGRHTPFFNGYRPQFYFRTTDVTGVCTLPSGVEMVMPGDNVTMTIELIQPVAMEKELRFAIREGGRTVGAGVVAEIAE